MWGRGMGMGMGIRGRGLTVRFNRLSGYEFGYSGGFCEGSWVGCKFLFCFFSLSCLS